MRCVGSKAPKRALKGHRLLVLEAPTGLRLLGIRFSPSTSSKGSVGPGKGPVTAKKPWFGGALRTKIRLHEMSFLLKKLFFAFFCGIIKLVKFFKVVH